MAGKNGFLTPTEFAKIIGVVPSVVRYAIKKGRLSVKVVKGKKLIEPEAGQKQWHETLDKAASKKGKKAKKKKGKKPGPKTEPYKAATFQGLTIHDAERREKVYRAKLSELKYLEQAGELVDVGKVKRQAFEAARKTRDMIMGLPGRLAHELAAETDPHKLEVHLTKELAATLEHLVKASEK